MILLASEQARTHSRRRICRSRAIEYSLVGYRVLFRDHGAAIKEGAGSRIRVTLNGARANFHRPHPSPNTDKGAVMSVRRFLMAAGV